MYRNGDINQKSLLCTQRDLESYLMETDLMTVLYPLLIKHIRKLKSFTVVMHIISQY